MTHFRHTPCVTLTFQQSIPFLMKLLPADLIFACQHEVVMCAVGVKLVMPALLEAVDNKAWRSKQGSVQMLGAMAFCAPRQLATALPLVVPKLATLLSDPHPKVQAATQRAFRQVQASCWARGCPV